MEWQPIETAPWDTYVLICGNNGPAFDMAVAWKDSSTDSVWMMTDYHDDITARAYRRHMAYPTHWMSLPEAPKP